MEKIKKALERARNSHSSNEVVGAANLNKTNRLEPEIPSNFEYSKTKCIAVSKESLRDKRVIAGDSNNIVFDQYKVLRTHVLQCLKSNQWNSLAITSPNEGCGKTLTAINLAISLAREVNHTVLLVDLDLRRPSIHTYFFQDEHCGISEYLIDDVDLSEILINPSIERLVILPGNKPFSNSSEMLSSPKMVQLVSELKNRYPNRIVIFDMPPLLLCDDMIAFSPYVDAILMVVEEGRTRKDELKKSFELIKNHNFIGTVLNKSKEISTAYGSYY